MQECISQAFDCTITCFHPGREFVCVDNTHCLYIHGLTDGMRKLVIRKLLQSKPKTADIASQPQMHRFAAGHACMQIQDQAGGVRQTLLIKCCHPPLPMISLKAFVRSKVRGQTKQIDEDPQRIRRQKARTWFHASCKPATSSPPIVRSATPRANWSAQSAAGSEMP